MPATIVQTKTGIQNAAIASYTLTLDAPAATGNEIIIVMAVDAYFNAPPPGFSEPSGARQERYLGHYLWHKTAAGGETSFTATPQVACWGVWAVYEVSGLSGAGSMIGSAGQAVVLSGSATYSTPTLNVSAGERFVMATLGGSYSGALSTISGWTNSFSEITDIRTTLGSGTCDSLGVAIRQGTFSAGQTVNTQATWDGGMQPESQTAIIVVFNIGGADTTPPSVPANVRVTKRTARSLTVAWDASTDNVVINGYEIQLDGQPAGTTTATNLTLYGLNESTSYQIRVRAYDSANNYSSFSPAITMATIEGSGSYIWTGSAKQLIDPIPVDPSTHYSILPRVPWEGGPAYYSSIPALASTEWTSENFFPIGYWGAYVDQQAHITKYASLNINTIWTSYAINSNSASWIRTAGLWNMGGVLPNSGSEHLGYVVEDEADMWAGAGWGGWTGATGFVPNVCTSGQGDCGYTIMQQTEAAFPQDGKLRWTNYGLGVMTYLGDTAASGFVNGVTPGGSWPMHLVTGDMYFYTGGGSMVADAEIYFGRDGAAARRAGNYGELIMNRLRYLDGLQGGRKPLGVVVELGGQVTGGEEMTPEKVEGAVWSTIIHEARCVSYFSHAFANTTNNPWSSNVLVDNSGNYPQVQARVAQVNTQIRQLAPVLNTQSYQWLGANNIASMFKIKNGFAYIFAMAKVETVHSPAPRTFRLPFGVSGKTAEVLFESRTIPVRAGAITDTFVNETTHHIYKVALT